MRKTSKFARNRRHAGREWDRTAPMGVLQRSRSYTDKLPADIGLADTQGAANKAIANVRGAFDRLKAGLTPAADDRDFDVLTHALGVSCIRAGQIAGQDNQRNAMLPPLTAGNRTLQAVLARRRKWGKWELLSQEVAALDWAIEIYETIVLASSPAQMTAAMDLRAKAFRGATLGAL